jgi:tetratricopeptide (TPR) repeat protein
VRTNVKILAGIAALLCGTAGDAQQRIEERIRNVETLQRTTSRNVFGISNELLTVGAEAMMAGRWQDGVRLTLKGLDEGRVSDDLRVSALSNLCGAYAVLNQPDLAIDYCTQSLEIDDANWHAWSNRSYAYWLQRQYDRAGDDLQRAMDLNDNARELAQIRGMLNEVALQPRIQMEDRQ